MKKIKIKICCISSIEEAMMAIKYGTDAIGLVGKMPSGPGPIADELIASIVKAIPSSISSFLLTSEQSSAGIIDHIKRTGANTVQIVDELNKGTHEEIRIALPEIKIVQVIHVTDESSVQQAMEVQSQVDAILLDSGNPKAAIKTLGGTGNTHDWDISKEIVKSVTKPVFLAGGLHPGNVKNAIETVKPFGVDLCNGVRINGKLDEEKLRNFFAAARQ